MEVQENSLPAYLDELRDGLPLSRAGACQLLRCPDDELPALLATALELKQRFKPGVVTYSRKVSIPLTNLCRDYCGYCIFRRDPGQPEIVDCGRLFNTGTPAFTSDSETRRQTAR